MSQHYLRVLEDKADRHIKEAMTITQRAADRHIKETMTITQRAEKYKAYASNLREYGLLVAKNLEGSSAPNLIFLMTEVFRYIDVIARLEMNDDTDVLTIYINDEVFDYVDSDGGIQFAKPSTEELESPIEIYELVNDNAGWQTPDMQDISGSVALAAIFGNTADVAAIADTAATMYKHIDRKEKREYIEMCKAYKTMALAHK